MSFPIVQLRIDRGRRRLLSWLPVALLIVAFSGSLFFPADAKASDQSRTGTLKHITLMVIDAANGDPLSNAVISVVDSGPAKAEPDAAEMAQKNHTFVPHVLIVPQHQAVDFPNRDTTRHHVYSFSRAKQFNIELYAGHPKAPVDFDTPGVVELGCNIHDEMQAFIYVARYARSGLTDTNGQVEIAVPESVPVKLRVWHERLKDNTRSVSRKIDPGNPANFTLSLKVTPPPTNDGAFSDLQKRFDNL